MSGLVGTSVVVGIRCVDPESGRELDAFSVEGTVAEDDEQWIAIRRDGIPGLYGVPPGPEKFVAGGDGALSASLTVGCRDADELLVIRGLGYVPA